VYILPQEALTASMKLQPSPRGEYELTDALNRLAASGMRIGVLHDAGDWWFDVGRPSDYLRANMYSLVKKLGDVVQLGEAVKIGPGVMLRGPCTIGDRVRLGAGSSVVGPAMLAEDVYVGGNCVVEASVLLENARIGEGVSISYAVIGENATIGPGVVLKYAGQEALPRLVVGPGASIPAGATIKAGSVVE